MITLLERAAGTAPEQTAVVTSEGSVSYGELARDARRVGAALRARGVERFALVEPDAALVTSVLAGAALAGAEPCQYEPDIDPGALERQGKTLGHSVIVSRRPELASAGALIAPGELVAEAPGHDLAPPASRPLMVRTTGTTGTPKAARHDWRVLVRRVEGLEPRPEERWLLAFGPHQFSGIQVILHVLARGATLVAPYPRRPRDGLQAMLDHEVTAISATPTYVRFLLTEARSREVDPPPLEQVTLGGEAVPGDLLERVKEAFPNARISQIYGSTETGTIISVRDGRPGFPVSALYSESNPDANVRLIDGEIWVRRKAAMLGYAGEDENEERREEDGWWPTGDLAEIAGDRVVFRGRNSDIVNVGGVKVHPLPVEHRIAEIPGVAAARVYGRPNPLTGAIVAVEVVPDENAGKDDRNRIRRQVKRAVSDLPPAWHPRSVTFVDSVKTRGGKTVRSMRS